MKGDWCSRLIRYSWIQHLRTDLITGLIFLLPRKNLLGNPVSTYGFNLLVIWLMTLVLYVTLYAELLRKAVSALVFRNVKWVRNK